MNVVCVHTSLSMYLVNKIHKKYARVTCTHMVWTVPHTQSGGSECSLRLSYTEVLKTNNNWVPLWRTKEKGMQTVKQYPSRQKNKYKVFLLCYITGLDSYVKGQRWGRGRWYGNPAGHGKDSALFCMWWKNHHFWGETLPEWRLLCTELYQPHTHMPMPQPQDLRMWP